MGGAQSPTIKIPQSLTIKNTCTGLVGACACSIFRVLEILSYKLAYLGDVGAVGEGNQAGRVTRGQAQ